MRIISTAYFYGDLSIAQISQLTVKADVEWLIDKYESNFLRQLFGQELFSQYKVGTEATDGSAFLDESLVAQKWKDLRDGKQYTNRNGMVVYFNGLAKKTTSTTKLSPIANFVYFNHLRKMATSTTGSGEAAVQSENAIPASSIDKQVTIWNQMVEMNLELYDFLLSNPNDYPSFSDYIWRTDRELITTINSVL